MTSIGLAVSAIVALQALLGWYAAHLNTIFYDRFGPFFDSVSYYNKLIDIHVAARDEGFVQALRAALEQSTTALPWLVYAPVAAWLVPSRALGVWLQVLPATILHIALYLYFTRERRLDAPTAFGLSSAFFFFAAIFRFNGGLSDFRMDLQQYLLYTLMMIAYLVARGSRTRRRWALFGVAVGVLCLGRATSPVYLALLFALLLPLDLRAAERRERWTLARRWALAAATALLIAGWFYVVQFEYLHYYYVVWNLDANARLPVGESWRHLAQALDHAGWPLVGAATFVLGLTLLVERRRRHAGLRLRIAWRPLWFSAVPLGFLVASGAGLNPFVSMVGVSGALLFALDPLDAPARPRPQFVRIATPVVIGVAALLAAQHGPGNHTRTDVVPAWVPRSDGLRALTTAIQETLRELPRRSQHYSFVHIGTLSAPGLFNVLVFDRHLTPRRHGEVEIDGHRLGHWAIHQIDATEQGWLRLPGSTDKERIDAVVEQVRQRADLLILATDDSRLPDNVYSNRFVPEINRRLTSSGRWEAVTGPLRLSPTERVVLYHRRGAAPGVGLRRGGVPTTGEARYAVAR